MLDEGITVLSLFDGISCGQLALARAGIKVKKYFAAEIKPIALKCAMANFPDTIQIGDVTKVNFSDGILKTEKGSFEVGAIDLLIGGSPCQDFTIMKYINQGENLGLEGEKSRLFYEYLRIKRETKARFFLLENVEMRKDRERQLNEFLKVEGIHINSSLVSYQNRPRVYWTNIPGVKVPADRDIDFQDYIESGGGLKNTKSIERRRERKCGMRAKVTRVWEIAIM
ncbi:hypothetical protein FACS189499_06620 [Clostridia bacterium]|nr:hypothetical protein FACS189499_06620 [Clostridia bacterium]